MARDPVWVRVGGGFELVPGGDRHGPADLSLPPPGGLWRPLLHEGTLVGWSAADGESAEAVAEMGAELAREQRAHLLSRLDHKLRSAVLALQETARAVAYGRGTEVASVYEQAEEVGRRAAGLAAAAIDPKEPARTVVLAAAVQSAGPGLAQVPGDAIVFAPEPVLVAVLHRFFEWSGGPREVTATRVGQWWRLALEGHRPPLEVPELGEPLLRYLVDVQLGGWLDANRPDLAALYLPAAG